MPIYSWSCPSCDNKHEDLMKYEEMKLIAEIVCHPCTDGRVGKYSDIKVCMKQDINLVAKTAGRWGGGWNNGLSGSGMWSQSLGKRVASKYEEQKEMEAKGFVNVRDLGSHYVDDRLEGIRKKDKEQDKIAALYQKNLKETGSEEEAVTKTFTAEKCLDGTLSKIYED